MFHLLADFVVLVHVGFVLFVIFGILLALKWKWMAWVHIPAICWGALVELKGWICPLTPLEIWLRRMAGEAGYRSDFLEHYILPLLYPGSLTRTLQVVLGLVLVAGNIASYSLLYFHRRRGNGTE